MSSAHFLDTSALIKLLLHPDIKEPGSESLYNFRRTHTGFYTLDLCVGEALNVLKQKAFSTKSRRKVLTKEGYFMRIQLLRSMCKQGHTLYIVPVNLSDDVLAQEANELCKQYQIDFVDALVAIKAIQHHAELFITAEKELTKAAESIGLTVWRCSRDESPLPEGIV